MKSAILFTFNLIAGFVIGYATCFLLYFAAATLFGMTDREGGMGIAIAMFIGPAVGFAVGLTLAIKRLPRPTPKL